MTKRYDAKIPGTLAILSWQEGYYCVCECTHEYALGVWRWNVCVCMCVHCMPVHVGVLTHAYTHYFL